MDLLEIGKNAISIEIDNLKRTCDNLGQDFLKAIDIIIGCKGRVIITGMGKSGHIGKKIAATMSSTGTPSFFLHPAEAVHGDLGILVQGDVILAISYSGETDEIKAVIPLVKRYGLPMISIVGNVNSTLAQMSDAVLDGSITSEACPMNLAPTSSTTVALALGDALAVALVKKRNFTSENFALVHPAGSLGRRLLMTVRQMHHTGDELPLVSKDALMKDLLYTISEKRLGCAIVIDGNNNILGIVTDGDLRRAMEKHSDIYSVSAEQVMSSNPKTIQAGELAVEAIALMEKYSISSVITVENDKPVGILHFQDLLQAGLL